MIINEAKVREYNQRSIDLGQLRESFLRIRLNVSGAT